MARAEGARLVREFSKVGLQKQTGQIVPRIRAQKSGLFVVEAQRLEHGTVRQHVLRVELAVDHSEHVSAGCGRGAFRVRVGDHAETELGDVVKKSLITRPGDVIRAEVGIQAVRQAVATREHMSAMPAAGFEHDDFMAAAHQFVRAAQAGNAGAGHDDLLAPRRLLHDRRCGVCKRRSRHGQLDARRRDGPQEFPPVHLGHRISCADGGRCLASCSNRVGTSPVIETLDAWRFARAPNPVTVACTSYSPA